MYAPFVFGISPAVGLSPSTCSFIQLGFGAVLWLTTSRLQAPLGPLPREQEEEEVSGRCLWTRRMRSRRCCRGMTGAAARRGGSRSSLSRAIIRPRGPLWCLELCTMLDRPSIYGVRDSVTCPLPTHSYTHKLTHSHIFIHTSSLFVHVSFLCQGIHQVGAMPQTLDPWPWTDKLSFF
jgi:hypothetical protein